MKYPAIKKHLAPYIISRRRKTTINHAFASALAPNDEYDADKIKHAIRLLKQNPEQDLRCAYCGQPAETWDHVFATVRNSSFSGAGHRIGNLLPCCKPCNSSKGGKKWETYLTQVKKATSSLNRRRTLIRGYLTKLHKAETIREPSAEHKKLNKIRLRILDLMTQADKIASQIRSKNKKRR